MTFDSTFWTSHTLLGNSPQQTLDINVIWSVPLFSFKLIHELCIIPRIHSSRLANLLTTREKCEEWCLKSDRSMPVVSSCTRAISEVDWMNKTSINIILNTFSQFGYFDDKIILPWVWWKKKSCKNFFQVTKIRFISDFQLEKVLIKSQKAN